MYALPLALLRIRGVSLIQVFRKIPRFLGVALPLCVLMAFCGGMISGPVGAGTAAFGWLLFLGWIALMRESARKPTSP